MVEIEKYKWKYQTFKENGKFRFNVVPPFELTPPKTLFRYYSTSERAIESVLNNYVYASHPDLFNDMYDCHEELIDFDDDEITLNFLSGGDEEVKRFLATEINKNREGVVQGAQRNFRQVLYRKMGIVCMTGNPNNILMWSYYTNNRGFLVEYDYKSFPFNFHGPFPVNYQEELEKISLKKAGMPLCAIFQSNVKHKGWEQENEWRILVENPEGEMNSPSMFPELADLGGKERKFFYPVEVIKSIAFGHYFIEPRELRIIDNEIFEINLINPSDIKAQLLDFMDANRITAAYTSRLPNLKSIGYFKGTIKKVAIGKYTFHRIRE